MAKIDDMSEKQIIALIDKAVATYDGSCNDLEGAIGALLVGRRMGWKPLFLMHDKKKIKKYEAVLGVDFREMLVPEGDKAHRSVAYKAAKKISNFWKAVTGNIPNIRSNEITSN